MLYPFLRQCIDVPVTNKVIHDTTIKQKARFLRLAHTQAADGTCQATIAVELQLYAAMGDEFGPVLTGPGFTAAEVLLEANNRTIVDAATGAILRIRTDAETDAQWQAAAADYEQAVMFQGDFFELMRHYSPIDIEDLIRQHIAQADQMGRFL